MLYIFLDESGDLGFKKTSSKWFIFGGVIIDNDRLIEKIVKKIWKNLKNKRRGELHATHENNKIKKNILKMMGELDGISVVCIAVNKTKFNKEPYNKSDYLYYSTIYVLISKILDILNKSIDLLIFIDKKDTKKSTRDVLINKLVDSLKKSYSNKIAILIESSHDRKSLQAVDFISWALFQKYEKGDSEFYNLFKIKIICEEILEKESPLL